MASISVEFVPVGHRVVITGGPPDLGYIDFGGDSSGLSQFSGFTNTVEAGFSGLAATQFYDGLVRGTSTFQYWTIFVSLEDTARTNFETTFRFRNASAQPTGHGLATNTVLATNTWWTIQTKSSTQNIYIARTSAEWTAAATLPVINYDAAASTPQYVDFAVEILTIEEIGFDAVAASNTSMPPNCLHPDVAVVVDRDGTTKRVADLASGDKVVIATPGGRLRQVPATVVKTRAALHTMYAWQKDVALVTSKHHVLYIPKTQHDVRQVGLPRGFPQVDGCVPVKASAAPAHLAEATHMVCPLYHLVLPAEFRECPVALGGGGGWFTEPLRHELGSERRDALFEVVAAKPTPKRRQTNGWHKPSFNRQPPARYRSASWSRPKAWV